MTPSLGLINLVNSHSRETFTYVILFYVLFSFYFNLIEVQLIYNVVLISAVQQCDSVIHIYIYIYSFLYSFPLWFIPGY